MYRLNTQPDVEDSLIRLSAQQGREVPSKVANSPAVNEWEEVFWLAFVQLCSHRIPDGSIPWKAIADWATYYGLEEEDAEDLIDIVRALDLAYLSYVKDKRSKKTGPEIKSE